MSSGKQRIEEEKLDSNPDYKFIFFNVGQGDATLLCYLVTNGCILVDVYKSEPILEEIKKSHLTLEAVFISHWDEDHLKGLPSILNYQKQFKGEIILGINRQIKKTDVSKKCIQSIDLAIEEGIIRGNDAIPVLKSYKTIPNFEGFDIQVLWPPHFQGLKDSDVNKDSVILKVATKGKCTLLLSGDASGDCWEKIDSEDLHTVIFKFPHHGGSINTKMTATELIERVNPKKVVVSYGKGNNHKHPNEEYKKAKSGLSDKIEFYDTSEFDVNIVYDSSINHYTDMLTIEK